MLKKHTLLAGCMAAVFFFSAPEAKAQGWPVFDVGKLSALIMNLAGRFQPIPTTLQRVSQVKDIQSQIKAAGLGDMTSSLKSMGKEGLKSVQGDALSFGKTEAEKAGEGGGAAASKKIQETLFLKKGTQPSAEDIKDVREARDQMNDLEEKGYIAKSLYMASNASPDTLKRLEAVEKADNDASTYQDKINANTMAVMAENWELLNQVTLKMSEMGFMYSSYLTNIPPEGYKKPKAPTFTGSSDSNQPFEKDEIDVDL